MSEANSQHALWIELAAKANVSLGENQIALFEKYLELLFAANARMNLTRITEPDAARLLHIADSLTILPWISKDAKKLADVGSGGGMPGIVLAIARPELSVLLIESTQKKAKFLQDTIAELGLKNVAVDARRVEEIGNSELRETFDVVVARAVATLDWLGEWMLPLAKKGGIALAMKGKKAAEELAGAQHVFTRMAGGKANVVPVELAGTEHHVVVEIPKIGHTDRRYPRLPTFAKGRALT